MPVAALSQLGGENSPAELNLGDGRVIRLDEVIARFPGTIRSGEVRGSGVEIDPATGAARPAHLHARLPGPFRRFTGALLRGQASLETTEVQKTTW